MMHTVEKRTIRWDIDKNFHGQSIYHEFVNSGFDRTGLNLFLRIGQQVNRPLHLKGFSFHLPASYVKCLSDLGVNLQLQNYANLHVLHIPSIPRRKLEPACLYVYQNERYLGHVEGKSNLLVYWWTLDVFIQC